MATPTVSFLALSDHADAHGTPDPTEVGAWSTPFDGEVPAVNMALLHDGRILYYSGVEADETDHDHEATFFNSEPVYSESRVLDLAGPKPVIITPTDADGAGGDLFCSGFVHLPFGQILAAGGTDWDTLPETSTPVQGIHDARIFDPVTDSWRAVDDMDHGRWYPSVIQDADGDALSISGIRNLTQPPTMVLPWERYDVGTESWSVVPDADRLLPLYPRVSVVPGGPLKGDVFYNTVGTLWGPFGEHPAEATWSLQQSFDPDTGTWTTHGPSIYGARQHAATIMLPLSADDDYAPEYLTFGGTLQRTIAAVPFAERINLASGTPVNTEAADMNHARWHLNGVLLPTGDVLAIGGGTYDNVVVHGQDNPPVMAGELYDPDTDTWTELPEMSVPRMYHSTAALLPDGSVLVGGHVPLPNPFKPLRDTVNPQVKESRFEIYSPAYMFSDDRPVIDSAPSATTYGDTMSILVEHEPTETTIDSIVLVHPTSTTHSFDSGQRSIELDMEIDLATPTGTWLEATLPPDGTVAQPGPWMVFVNARNADGDLLPSEGKWIWLH